jgi:hypothetical protein
MKGAVAQLTIDGALKLLIADFARELANTRFLVQLDGDRLLVVAE